MSEQKSAERGTFGRMGFILAAAGSAIGLGNIWKFPYIAYANDGGSFVLIYLAAILLVGAPIMLAETLIGRRTQQSPVGAFLRLAIEEKVPGGRRWGWLGGLGVFAGLAILSYYAVVAGWVVYYFLHCLRWSFQGFSGDATSLVTEFQGFLANPGLQIGFHGLFMTITVLIVILGVKAGIERTTKFLMPVLLVILLAMVLNSMRSPGFGDAISFLFHVGPIHASGVLEALGHAFFTLSLGMGAMITYGSYVSRGQSIPRAGGVICLLDTLIALMAAVVMFSIIFSVPLAERAGTFGRSSTILFTTLPRMFYDLPAGTLIAPVFYLLVAFAALTSTISLLEVVVAYFIDVREWSRRKASLVVGAIIFLAGIPSALSVGAVGKLTHFQLPGLPEGAQGFFGTVDYLATNWLLPVGGLGIALFAGWVLSSKLTREELEEGHGGRFSLFPVWRFLVRYVCPVAILWILWEVLNGRSFA
jgi:neurotransmitter:Na+ symporter, NSS family